MEREAGWYRDPLGNLRYWNGESWAGQSVVHAPAHVPARRLTPAPRWRLPVMTLGWVAAIFTLGMLLTGVSADRMDCGYVFAPHRSEASCEAALHSRTTTAGLTATVALLCFAANSRAATRLAASRSLRGTPVLA